MSQNNPNALSRMLGYLSILFLSLLVMVPSAVAQTTQPAATFSLSYGDKAITLTDTPTWSETGVLKFTPSPKWESGFVYVDWRTIGDRGVIRPDANGTFTLGGLSVGKHLVVIADGSVNRTRDLQHTFSVEVVKAADTIVDRYWGTISDNGTPATNVPLMKEAGFDSIRIWMSFNPVTGVVNESAVDRANAYVAAGFKVMVVLTPEVNATSVVHPAEAIKTLKAKLNKAILIHIFNEVNLAYYWPNGDVAVAAKAAAKISRELQAAGFRTGSFSLTYGDTTVIKKWLADAVSAGDFPFDFTVIHNYPRWDANWEGTALLSFENVLLAAKSAGKPVICDEWGFDITWPKDVIAGQLPRYKALLDKHTVGSAYFIFSRTFNADGSPKLPHDNFPWLYDPKTNTKTPMFEVFKKLSKNVVIISSTADRNNGFAPVTYEGVVSGYTDGGWPRGASKRWIEGTTVDITIRNWGINKIPAGTPYLLNVLEGHWDDGSLAVVNDALKYAKSRGLVTSFYGFPIDARWEGRVNNPGTVWELTVPSNMSILGKIGLNLDMLVAQEYRGPITPITADEEKIIQNNLTETLRIAAGDLGRVALIITPFAGDGESAVPVQVNMRLLDIAYSRGYRTFWIWSDQGASAHCKETIKAAKLWAQTAEAGYRRAA